jgi:hypothetical protein
MISSRANISVDNVLVLLACVILQSGHVDDFYNILEDQDTWGARISRTQIPLERPCAPIRISLSAAIHWRQFRNAMNGECVQTRTQFRSEFRNYFRNCSISDRHTNADSKESFINCTQRTHKLNAISANTTHNMHLLQTFTPLNRYEATSQWHLEERLLEHADMSRKWTGRDSQREHWTDEVGASRKWQGKSMCKMCGKWRKPYQEPISSLGRFNSVNISCLQTNTIMWGLYRYYSHNLLIY